MKTYEITDFVGQLGCMLPSVERFWQLGDLTALRRDENGRFYRSNYERGILLYVLVAKYRPSAILEFGTGRGYGSLCMAWAMDDFKVPGKIYTIDMLGQDEKFKWPIDWGDGPRVEELARSQIWPKAAVPAWLDRVNTLTGYTGQVMSRWDGPRVEFSFIDGGHSYDAVRHDYYSVLEVAGDRLGILFDDYSPRFGVKRMIDQEVASHFDPALIYTDQRWTNGGQSAMENPDCGMVWTYTENATTVQSIHRQSRKSLKFLKHYRRIESIVMLRNRLGRLVHRLGLR